MLLDNVIDDPLNIARKDAGLFEKISNFPIPVIDATRRRLRFRNRDRLRFRRGNLLLQIGNFPAQFRQRVKWIRRRLRRFRQMREDFDLRFLPELSDAVRFKFADVEDHRFRPKLRANLRDRFRSRIRDERVNFHSGTALFVARDNRGGLNFDARRNFGIRENREIGKSAFEESTERQAQLWRAQNKRLMTD